MIKPKKRPFLLLEVLIAFVLVVLFIIPMIYPHVYILKAQHDFIRTVELDHGVNIMYGELVQRLYQNSISWEDIESEREFQADELLKSINYPQNLAYNGTYHFKILKFKPPPPAARTLNLVELTLEFFPKGLSEKEAKSKTLEYKYKLFIVRSPKEVQ